MDDSIFADALQKLLLAECPPERVRRIDDEISQGAPALAATLAATLEASGFADAMVSTDQGGAGLNLGQAFALFELCGRFAVPVPLAETLLVRGWLAQQGRVVPTGLVGWGGLAPVNPVNPARAERVDLAPGLDLFTLQACLNAAQMAGALQGVLEMTLAYANQREQFGRPIGKFQAIQHQLAVMAQQALAARMAAQIGCRPSAANALLPHRLNVAVAKARCSEAAVEVAALAHAIHGAIGFTHDFDLQRYTRRLHAWRQAAGSESHWHGVLGAELLHNRQGLSLDMVRDLTD